MLGGLVCDLVGLVVGFDLYNRCRQPRAAGTWHGPLLCWQRGSPTERLRKWTSWLVVCGDVGVQGLSLEVEVDEENAVAKPGKTTVRDTTCPTTIYTTDAHLLSSFRVTKNGWVGVITWQREPPPTTLLQRPTLPDPPPIIYMDHVNPITSRRTGGLFSLGLTSHQD